MVPGRRPQRLQHVHIAVSMHTCPRSRLWTEDRSTHRRRLHVDPPSGFIALYTCLGARKKIPFFFPPIMAVHYASKCSIM